VRDAELRELLQNGELDLACRSILETFGGEVMRFFVNRARDPELASEAFAMFSEDIWRGLPGFVFRSSARTWTFSVAYHALLRAARCSSRHSRGMSLSDVQSQPARTQTRTATPPYLQSDAKQRLLELRGRLSEEDQALLDLRVIRRFSWKDIARIRLHAIPEPEPEPIDVRREAARLRKRFELLRRRLRDMARADGILRDGEDP
jgi:RNA polymerase sigma-70 factor (ECF subfamily)